MSKSKVFIFLAISFAFGVLVASSFDLPKDAVYLLVAICITGFALTYINGLKIGALGALFLFCFGLGVLRLQFSMVDSEFQNLFGSNQQLQGYVAEEPDVRDNRQLLHFRPKDSRQNIIITTTLAQDFFYGDLLAVDGKLAEPKSFSDFDYKGYLERHNVYAQMSYPKILILKSSQLNPLKENLLKIKSAFVKKLGEYFSEPQNSLLLGILIGAKKNLPQNIVDDFNSTGTSHIIAVSGFNITIMITALASLARVVGRRFSFWLTVSVIAAFVIITGASASVIRAAIMGFLLLLSYNIGRQYSVAPAIFFAGTVMLILNPKILYWDVGFQLSFAATLGIVYFLPLLNQLTTKWPEIFVLKTAFLTTLSAIVATQPLVLLNFDRLSLSAPIVNVLVVPIVPLAMLFGFLSLIPFLGSGFAFTAKLVLAYILKVISFFARLPFGSLNLHISTWGFWLLLAAIFVLYSILYRLSKKSQTVGQTAQT